jgi:hypothetical protein
MLIFDLTPDVVVAEGHTSHPDNSSIKIEVKFAEALTE